MWVSVSSTPGTLLIRPAMTSAICSNSRTRTIAIRSTSPAVEYTSLSPSRSALDDAPSGMESVAASIMTMAVITPAMLSVRGVRDRLTGGHPLRSGPGTQGAAVGEGIAVGAAGLHPGEERRVRPGAGGRAGEHAVELHQPGARLLHPAQHQLGLVDGGGEFAVRTERCLRGRQQARERAPHRRAAWSPA